MLFFIASKVFWLLVRPLSLLILCVAAGAVFLAIGWQRLALWLMIVAVVGYGVAEHTVVGDWVLRPLENAYSVPSPLPHHVDGIIVLGGALGRGELAEDRDEVPLTAEAERMTRTVDLARHYPQARVVFSGFSGALVPRGPSESDLARRFFLESGLSEDRLTFENQSRNTAENAAFSQRLVRPQNGEVWLLVTSAFHMRRSVACFRAVDWPVVPYPVDYRTTRHGEEGSWLVMENGLVTLTLGLREWVGLWAYRLTGKIKE